ncbi:MAG: ribonuclease III [Oscillospiraceae bacterium]
MRNFEDVIGYQFKNPSLLNEALTHSSYAHEGKKSANNNERLEFLGDSVLSVIVTEHLFCNHKDYPEGELTKIRASLVCETSLFNFAKKINLGQYLKLGKGEIVSGGSQRPSILADAFEAVIAAIYIDGGIEAARKYVMGFIPNDTDAKTNSTLCDYKTSLQEIIQQNKEEKIEYVLIDEKGPDHSKTFTVELHLNSNVIGTGTGKSKKQAEQIAAREALELMGYEA